MLLLLYLLLSTARRCDRRAGSLRVMLFLWCAGRGACDPICGAGKYFEISLGACQDCPAGSYCTETGYSYMTDGACPSVRGFYLLRKSSLDASPPHTLKSPPRFFSHHRASTVLQARVCAASWAFGAPSTALLATLARQAASRPRQAPTQSFRASRARRAPTARPARHPATTRQPTAQQGPTQALQRPAPF